MIVPDTSVIVSGKFREYIVKKKDARDSINMDSDRRIVSSAVSYLEFKNFINAKKSLL